MMNLQPEQIQKIIKRFEEYGSVKDRRHGNSGRQSSIKISMAIEEVKAHISKTP